jgi:hypothetical protein
MFCHFNSSRAITLLQLGQKKGHTPLGLGEKLAAEIGKKMDVRFDFSGRHVGGGDLQLYQQLTYQRETDAREIQFGGWRIRDGIPLSQSIDDFLDLHRDDSFVNLVGKAAIVKTILEAERRSKLALVEQADGQQFKPEKLTNTWLLKFMHMLSRGIAKADVRQIFNNVAFIIFNYDRCVEHFLYNALQKLYGINEKDAADILADCTIIHPYGLVGPYLPIGRVPFGAGSTNYRELSKQIKTYTEQITAADVMSEIQRILSGGLYRLSWLCIPHAEHAPTEAGEGDQTKTCVWHCVPDVRFRYRCCFAPSGRFL